MKKLLLVALVGALGLGSNVFAVRTDRKGTGADTARARQAAENAEREEAVAMAEYDDFLKREAGRQVYRGSDSTAEYQEFMMDRQAEEYQEFLKNVDNGYPHSEGDAEYVESERNFWDNVAKPYLQSKGYMAQSEQPVVIESVQKEPTVEIVPAPVIETSKGLTDNQYAAFGTAVAVTAAVAVTYGSYKLAKWAYNAWKKSAANKSTAASSTSTSQVPAPSVA